MLRVTPSTLDQKRTLRPLYAQHQATPYGGFLDPNWVKSTQDIYPGMVMCRTTLENFTLYQGSGAQKPFGLSALFVAPTLGIDETLLNNTNLFTVWIGGPDAVFEVLAPAFAVDATGWTNPTDGSKLGLGVTSSSHTNGAAKLAPLGGANVSASRFATLIDFFGPSKIMIQLDKNDNA